MWALDQLYQITNDIDGSVHQYSVNSMNCFESWHSCISLKVVANMLIFRENKQ